MDADGGDQVADELKSLDLKDTASVEEEVVEDEESQNLRSERVPSVSMRTMHFTNGDWYPEEKPKIAPPSDPVERAVPSEGSGENVSEARKTLDEAELSSEEDDTDAMERYANEKTGEVPESFFEILCRECTKIPYTPEEQQERRNSGHLERNKMLLEGIKTNHREWMYQIEERIALEMMNERRKARKKALKEQRKLAEAVAGSGLDAQATA
ncbi:uncharacterized protein LOC111266808 isoform X2 [Varroa jacobsoni]|uniref:Uncharacterized protein n=1 Tax=Varroa destructor TaxID=109461 RepID=A0A7M7KD16_VARDE|nr:uncharacterized protein LOC111249522 isoform X2 [Varroa destructor]XP_022700341.1 uncharacterized protein LOC111266808 isoform X2 [Varroa jacobsoni]